MSEILAFLEGEPLDGVTKDLLRVTAKALQEFLQKYGIKKTISADEAKRISVENPNIVFSTISTESEVEYKLSTGTTSARVVTQLCSGINPHESTLDYFLAEHPYKEVEPAWLDIEFMLTCQACFEEQQELGEAECDDCGREDGNLMYALIWDQSGNVTIDRLDAEDF